MIRPGGREGHCVDPVARVGMRRVLPGGCLTVAKVPCPGLHRATGVCGGEGDRQGRGPGCYVRLELDHGCRYLLLDDEDGGQGIHVVAAGAIIKTLETGFVCPALEGVCHIIGREPVCGLDLVVIPEPGVFWSKLFRLR